MKNRLLTSIALQITVFLISTSTVSAWTGDGWGPVSRETIVRNADEMIDFSWSPLNTITNDTCTSDGAKTFYKDTIYIGEAYTQCDTRNWAEFYSIVNSISGGNVKYGNDCSGFASMSWKLPERYNTTAFDCDAKDEPTSCNQYNPATDNYVTKLGEVGTGESVKLQRGDAFVKSGSHIILFEDYLYNGQTKIGIKALEQTPYWATRSTWTWSGLSSYRPIRRDKILDYVFQTKWGTGSCYNPTNSQFCGPDGIAVDSSGNVYVADTDNNRIQKFTSNGTFVTKWGSYGTGNGQFDRPTGIAVNSGGNVYVVDSGNNRIQIFNGNGTYASKWGTYGCMTNGQLCDPYGIAVDSSSNVYVTEPDIARIQKFTSSGSYLAKINSYGSGNGQFDTPEGVAVDSNGYMYVADRINSRIQKFDSSFNYITQWGSFASGMYRPSGIAVDTTGNVYVSDTYEQHRIQKFTSDGKFITQWGSSYGSGDGQFDEPRGIAFDSSGMVYVVESYNNRIQKFSPFPSAPSNLSATASSNQINLSWQDNSNNETGFKVKKKTGVRGTYTTIATLGTNVTTLSDTNISSGNAYYYSVWAYNGAGESAYSNEVEVASYSLNVSKSGTGDGTVNGTGIDCGTDCTEYYVAGTTVSLTVMAAADSSFTGWSGSCTGTGVCSLTMNGNKNVTAAFKENPKITATAGIGGSISPSGTVMVGYNGNQTFTITPSTGYYYIFDVKVDGISQGNISNYTFSNVTSDHTIEASFAIFSYTISSEVSGGIGGTIIPPYADVSYGGSQTFNITPDTGYHIVNVEVDGVSKGAISSYAFTNLASSHVIKAAFSNTYALTITKSGTGTGTVTSSPSGISCGSTCSSSFNTGTAVTLTPMPASDSSFAGWSGGGCSGTGTCTVTMNADAAVTATFNILSPVADFTASPTSGYAPPSFTVNFTDASTNSPTSWNWNFGDDATSTLRNPSHAYSSAGTYSVSFTVTNASGTNTVTKNNYITAQLCPNSPVRILGKADYATLQAAYDAAVDGDTILSRGITLTENLNTNRNISVTIDGGYSCDYSSNPGATSLSGSMTINNGTVNIKNFNLQY